MDTVTPIAKPKSSWNLVVSSPTVEVPINVQEVNGSKATVNVGYIRFSRTNSVLMHKALITLAGDSDTADVDARAIFAEVDVPEIQSFIDTEEPLHEMALVKAVVKYLSNASISEATPAGNKVRVIDTRHNKRIPLTDLLDAYLDNVIFYPKLIGGIFTALNYSAETHGVLTEGEAKN